MYGLFVRFREWGLRFTVVRRLLLVALAGAFLFGLAQGQLTMLNGRADKPGPAAAAPGP